MSFFKGLAGGLARGVEDALTLEDEKIERQTAEALKEFKSRVKDQKKNRLARQGKLEDVIGSITGRGYSLTTAASLVKQNGIAGANKIMADSDLAYERGGISRNQFIEAVENASSPGALSSELSTVSQAAETLAFQAFPAISREEFSAPKAPFSGSIISPEDDQDPEYRAKMLERLSESGVLPEQAKPEFESLPSGNTFTINRDLVPTDLDIKRREMPTKARLLDIMATGTPEEKAKANGALRQIVAAENNNRFEELKNTYFDPTTSTEEQAEIAKQIQQFRAAGEDPLDTSKKIAAVVTAAVTQNNTAINSQFSRTRTASNDKALTPDQAALGVAQPKQKEQFKINGKVFEYVAVDSPEHKELEARYLKERRAQVKSLLDKQGIPDQNNIREQVEAMLLPEEVVSEVVDPGAGTEPDDPAPVVTKEMMEKNIRVNEEKSKEKLEAAKNLAATVTEFKRKYPDATSDTIVVAATENEPAVTLGQLEAKVALAGATEPQEPVAVNDETTPLDAEAYIRIARDAISGGGDDDTVEARVKRELGKRLPPRDAAALAGMWKLARYYKPRIVGLGSKRGPQEDESEENRQPQEEVSEENRRWARSTIATAIKGLTAGRAN